MRHPRRCAAAGALVLLLGACDTERAADGGAAPASLRALEPDLARGELLSLACQACHTLAAGGADGVGPNLHGIFGRPAATHKGFVYSPALERAALVWTPDALAAWLADPAGFLPGTTMAFTGYRSERDRRDLIAFLLEATRDTAAD